MYVEGWKNEIFVWNASLNGMRFEPDVLYYLMYGIGAVEMFLGIGFTGGFIAGRAGEFCGQIWRIVTFMIYPPG